MVLQERGERAPVAMLGQARMVSSRRAEVERDYVDHRCPACDRALKVRAAYAGKAVVCKFCGSGFVALALPVILPITGHRVPTDPASRPPSDARARNNAPADPRSDVIEYLASRVAEAGECNRRLEAERRQLREQIGHLRAELLHRSGSRTAPACHDAG